VSEQTEPLVSIVTVVYNAADTLSETLDSVVQQTYQNIDLVIIDGGSTDRTLEIVEQYRAHVNHVSSGKDSGIYDAMNKGVRAARGEWIIFLNAGDTFASPNVLAAAFAKTRGIESADVIYGRTKLKRSPTFLDPPQILDKRYFYFETLCHQSVLAKRGLFHSVGPFSLRYRIMADREWLLRATLQSARFVRTDEVIAVWDPVGYSSANAALSARENLDLQTRYFTWLERAILPWRMRITNSGRKLKNAFAMTKAFAVDDR
jgi:glycosyltransferase involved in cell wall biosynthesis